MTASQKSGLAICAVLHFLRRAGYATAAHIMEANIIYNEPILPPVQPARFQRYITVEVDNFPALDDQIYVAWSTGNGIPPNSMVLVPDDVRGVLLSFKTKGGNVASAKKEHHTKITFKMRLDEEKRSSIAKLHPSIPVSFRVVRKGDVDAIEVGQVSLRIQPQSTKSRAKVLYAQFAPNMAFGAHHTAHLSEVYRKRKLEAQVPPLSPPRELKKLRAGEEEAETHAAAAAPTNTANESATEESLLLKLAEISTQAWKEPQDKTTATPTS